ncbi:MAG: gfo/Idh/MocA family oxidoreductase, partial [Planctomycetales bacterium]|nr:gfo/Idh/MocA family oxidoreductase [Planctomycetales bacterium]
ILLPFGDDADLTYYKGRNKDDVIPPLGHFVEEWIRASKGNLKTHCDFNYGGTAIETMLLGLVAY